MDEHRVVWAEVENNVIGILPCGLTVAVIFIAQGLHMGAYKVRFGVSEQEGNFWSLDRAKRAGLELALQTLQNCADATSAEIKTYDKEKAQRPPWDDQQ